MVKPAMNPVINLNSLKLSLNPISRVVPSTAIGIDEIIKYHLLGILKSSNFLKNG